MDKISITKKINITDWNSVLENSKDTNIIQSQEYYEALNENQNFLRILAFEKQRPVSLLQGKIYTLKYIPLKKLHIGSMSGEGIAVIDTKKDHKRIKDKLIDFAEKEKIDLIEIWSFEKLNLPDYIKKETHTIILNLNQNKEKLWNNLNKKTRNLIRKAQKNKVEIHIEDKPNIKRYYNIYEKLAKRAKFTAIDHSSLKRCTHELTKKNILKVFAAYFEKKIVSFAYVLCYKKCIYYWIGASNKKAHEVAASDLLQWEIITWAQKNNYHNYNMWGADINPSSNSYSVYKFKIGFGGDLVKIYIYRKYLNKIAKMLYKLKNILTGIHRKTIHFPK